MGKENVTLDFRLNKIDEIRTYLLEETKHNDLVSKKHKNMWRFKLL